MYVNIYIYIYIYNIYIYRKRERYISKLKSTITRYVKYFVRGISASKNLLKETESVKDYDPR